VRIGDDASDPVERAAAKMRMGHFRSRRCGDGFGQARLPRLAKPRAPCSIAPFV
jgi:hypothetical protein